MRRPYEMTNMGLRIDMFLQLVLCYKGSEIYRAQLNCHRRDSPNPLWVFLLRDPEESLVSFSRTGPVFKRPPLPAHAQPTSRTTILVSNNWATEWLKWCNLLQLLENMKWDTLADKPPEPQQKPVVAENDWEYML